PSPTPFPYTTLFRSRFPAHRDTRQRTAGRREHLNDEGVRRLADQHRSGPGDEVERSRRGRRGGGVGAGAEQERGREECGGPHVAGTPYVRADRPLTRAAWATPSRSRQRVPTG